MERITDEQIVGLVGHPEEVNRVAESLLGFGFGIIKRWHSHRKYQDAVSEMQWTLLDALRRIANGKVTTPSLGYVGMKIRNQVLKFLVSDQAVKADDHTTTFRKDGHQKSVIQLTQNHWLEAVNDESRCLEIREIVTMSATNEKERLVMERTLSGDTDSEIAANYGEQLHLRSRQAVQQVRSRICLRIAAKLQLKN